LSSIVNDEKVGAGRQSRFFERDIKT